MSSASAKKLVAAFLPALIVWPLWLYCMTKAGVWTEAFENNYPMCLAMILGCLIAGSTPLGGAVVAFPVAVLVLKLKPTEGRDFAALIQSVGMVAAAYLIGIRKRHMVHAQMLMTCMFSNTIGVIIGFSLEVEGFWVNVIYTTYALVFAGLLAYKHFIKSSPGGQEQERSARLAAMVRRIRGISNQAKQAEQEGPEGFGEGRCTGDVEPCPATSDDASPTGSEMSDKQEMLLIPILIAFGLIGGFLTSKIGSGADTMAYVYGVFIHNSVVKTPLPESTLTVTSVVIMAFCTVVVAALRLIDGPGEGGISRNTFLCWGAVLWIVVLGAPIGSLILTKEREVFFRRLFYLLALIQFVTFAILKIKDRTDAWVVIGLSLVVTWGGCLVHFMFSQKGLAFCGSQNSEKSSEKEPQEESGPPQSASRLEV